jgi:hypothetical protein
MMITGARRLLIGFGLALALTLAPAGRAAAQAPDPAPRLKVGDQWNHGDDPWDGHPGGYTFNPERVGIIHIELLPNFTIKATRFHYDAIKKGSDTGWHVDQSNMAVRIINWLNGEEANKPQVTNECKFDGVRQLTFGQAQHVIVYVKNSNIKYPDRPVWFGNSLQGTIGKEDDPFLGKARENHSFFNAEVLTPGGITGSVSKQFVYLENHFHKYGFLSGHDPIQDGEIRVYSMKIALLSQSIEPMATDIPIIIDPDTGNMGGGYPMFNKRICPKP